MSLRAVVDPPLAEALRLYEFSGIRKPGAERVESAAALLQLIRSECVGYYAGASLVAVAAFYPLPPDGPFECRELAFVCRPALAHHLLAFIRLAHSTRALLAKNGPVRIVAHVHADHRPGARLAALCGMKRAGRRGAFDLWIFEGVPDVEVC